MNNDLREIAIRTDSGDAWENPFSQGVEKTGEEVDMRQQGFTGVL